MSEYFVSIIQTITIDINTLIDNVWLEKLLDNMLYDRSKSLLPYNVYAMNLLYEYYISNSSANLIIVGKNAKIYEDQIQTDLANSYKSIKCANYDSDVEYRILLKQSSLHIFSNPLHLRHISNSGAIITDNITYGFLWIISNKIIDYRCHFWGIFNMLSFIPILSPLSCLIINNINKNLINLDLSRSFLIGLFIATFLGDLGRTLLEIGEERSQFYSGYDVICAGLFIKDYSSKTLAVALWILTLLLLLFCFFYYNPFSMLFATIYSIICFFSYLMPWYSKLVLRVTSIILLSLGLQLNLFI